MVTLMWRSPVLLSGGRFKPPLIENPRPLVVTSRSTCQNFRKWVKIFSAFNIATNPVSIFEFKFLDLNFDILAILLLNDVASKKKTWKHLKKQNRANLCKIFVVFGPCLWYFVIVSSKKLLIWKYESKNLSINRKFWIHSRI